MGFDEIRFDAEVIPSRPHHIPETRYRQEVDYLTSGRAQVKVLSCTMDQYLVAHDGRLLLKVLHADPTALEGTAPCVDRPDYRWMSGYAGVMDPGELFEFRFQGGRVVAVRTLIPSC
jgi:hypothetical protein